MNLRLYDAHVHLQDERLRPYRAAILETLPREGIARLVVNGAAESDWPEVLSLARQCPRVIPSFGYHPWYVKERSGDWQPTLAHYLDQVRAGVGEIGLDRWVRGHNPEDQVDVFVWQLRLAAERNLPVSIHCLQAWGSLLELLQREPLPQCGFLLHSFGGPQELIGPLTELGAYFSLPGYFAHARKERQRETFRRIPPERLLIETDAPDQLLPEDRTTHPLCGTNGKPLNHPANLGAVYRFAAELFAEPVEPLAARVEANFLRLFGGVIAPPPTPQPVPGVQMRS